MISAYFIYSRNVGVCECVCLWMLFYCWDNSSGKSEFTEWWIDDRSSRIISDHLFVYFLLSLSLFLSLSLSLIQYNSVEHFFSLFFFFFFFLFLQSVSFSDSFSFFFFVSLSLLGGYLYIHLAFFLSLSFSKFLSVGRCYSLIFLSANGRDLFAALTNEFNPNWKKTRTENFLYPSSPFYIENVYSVGKKKVETTISF